MRYGICVLVVVCSLMPLSLLARTLPAPRIGVVDLSVIAVFHPAMHSYDHHREAFWREKPSPVFTQDKIRRVEESNEQVEAIRKKIKEIESRREAMLRRNDRELRELENQLQKTIAGLASEPANVHVSLYKKRRAELTQRNLTMLNAFDVQIEQQKRLSDQSSGSVERHLYTTPQETNERFKSIMAEIRGIIAAVAASKGIEVVIDASNSSRVRDQLRREAPSARVNVDYSSIFGLDTSTSAREADPHEPIGVLEMVFTASSILMQNRAGVLSSFEDHFSGTGIIQGGTDLTQDVLMAVLNQYRIDATIQSAIMQAVTTGN